MEFIGVIVVLGFVGVLLVGSALGIVSLFRTRDLEKQTRSLAARLGALEAGRPGPLGDPEAAAATAPPIEAPPVAAPPIETSEPATEPSVTPAPASDPGPPVAPEAPRAERLDLEALIGGRWLNRIGIVAVMLAVSFFLKYAFDNDWVGPTGRVAIGLLAGVGLMVLSQWLLGRGYRYFSDGIAALGAGVLFLSLYAAWSFYQLIPMGAAFAGMVLVTAALAGLAMGRDSERLALLALIAGLTTPVLLIPEGDRPNVVFNYLTVLAAGFLTVAWRKRWLWVAPVALAGIALHFAAWYTDRYSPQQLQPTCLYATLFFLLFGAFCVARSRGGGLARAELLLVPANALLYGLALFEMLYADHRWWLTATVLAVAALHLAAARSVPGNGAADASRAARFVFAGVALTFATSAFPIRLEGNWIVIALALEGALLVWAGLRADVRALRIVGAALMLLDILVLLEHHEVAERFLLNRRFAAFAVLTAALAAGVRWVGARTDLDTQERNLFKVAAAAAFLVGVWGLSEELWNALGRQTWGLDPDLARQMGLSLLWAVAAGLLILTGVRREIRGRRLLGLALLCFVALKVFVVDLSILDKAYRIASFLVLGIVLLVVSFWYQRSLTDRPGDSGEGAGDAP